MTIEEFKNQKWTAGMQAEYHEEIFEIISVDFDECLIGLNQFPQDDEDRISWKRCENCKLLPLDEPKQQEEKEFNFFDIKEEIQYDWGTSNVNK